MKNFIKNPAKYNLFLACFLGVALFSTASKASTSSIMIDADTGKVLSQYNADERRFPASLTKLMTLYLTFEALENGKLKMTDKLSVSRHAANMEPSRLGLRAGQKVELKTLINALIVKSANDCAVVLAETLGKTESQFAQKMTAKAQELGMKNTTFRNASGLPNAQQKTTARDMAKLASAIYNDFPQYYKLFAQTTYKYNGRTLYTHNHVLKKFKGADGMKTGYTRASGYNIITSAQRKGNRVIAVTMGHKTLKERDSKVMSMMDRGLITLALNDQNQTALRYASLKPIVSEPIQIDTETTSNDNAEKNWGIQIGAFSNYAKARNYALQVKRTTLQLFKGNDISIEPVASGAAVVYRSKIIGFAKNDADSACKKLKSQQQSCIVVASAPTSQLASADRY